MLIARIIAGALVFVGLFLIEKKAPHFPGRKARFTHSGRHFCIAFLNIVLVVLIFGGIIQSVFAYANSNNWGLLGLVHGPIWAETIIAILLFDIWMYAWHRANHRIKFLWRFHRAHHTDTEMDASTAFRFHPGEIMLSTLLRLLVGPLLIGMSLWQILLYETIALPVILFHHSNIRMPEKWDLPIRRFIVTPWMHWVHHSHLQPETDSNYGTIFSWWDRIFRSFRIRQDHQDIRFGLDKFSDERWQQIPFFYITPLGHVQKQTFNKDL
ncbi:MAG: sterol desaturase family protein [Candidatus Sumerlaeia bacterium]